MVRHELQNNSSSCNYYLAFNYYILRWGHRIPAYRVIFDDEEASESAQSTWIVAKSPEEALSKAEAKFGAKQFRLEQDPDCLE